MTESEWIKHLRAGLNSRFGSQVFYFKSHGGPFQQAGLPDLMGFLFGRGFAIEVKQRGNTPTTLQARTLRDIHNAGAITRVCYTDEAIEPIILWLAREAGAWRGQSVSCS